MDTYYCGVGQLVDRGTVNAEVAGSSPAPTANPNALITYEQALELLELESDLSPAARLQLIMDLLDPPMDEELIKK